MKRVAKLLCILTALALLFTACSSGSTGGDAAPPSGANGGGSDGSRDDVIVSLHADPEALHAGLATSVVSSLCSMHFFDTLVYKTNDGQYLPSLATEWEFVGDGASILFTLRDDVYFHNGEKMTAEDVAFSFNTILAAGYSDSITSAMVDMEVVDDSHVQLNFESVYGPAIECISQPALGVFQQAAYEADPDGFIRNPVGTGPYRFLSWSTGDSITMEANEEYWDGAPDIKNVTLKVYTNFSTASLALENGELDVHTNPPSTDYDRLSANSGLLFDKTLSSTVTWVMFSWKEITEDENLRLAIAHAIDKEAVLLGAIDGEGELANAVCPPFAYGIPADYKPPQYDLDKAMEYLEASGYGDGLELTIQANSSDLYYKAAEIVQAQLAEIGINCTIDKMDTNAWFNDVFRTGSYAWNPVTFTSSVVDLDYYYAMFVGGEGQNFGGIDIPELSDAFRRNRFSVDDTERAEAVGDIVRYMGDHAVVVPIYCSYRVVAANKDLVGVEANSQGLYCAADWSWA